MAVKNTSGSYGSVSRILHWTNALLILCAIAVALYVETLPRETEGEIGHVIARLSLHKTLGIAAFAIAVPRLLWAMVQKRPQPIHPERRVETLLADAVHWSLYIAIIAMPLSGWLGHSARPGLAPILWPFAQSLPFVTPSSSLAKICFSIHAVASKLLYLSIALHVIGALKHLIFDRDATLARMVTGRKTIARTAHRSHLAGAAAVVVWTLALALAIVLAQPTKTPSDSLADPKTTGNWQMSKGELTFTVKVLQTEVIGRFSDWNANIDFDENTMTGTTVVTIPLTGMTLGSVTQQAVGPEFLDMAAHPIATFNGTIANTNGQMAATGTLTLRGRQVPVALPFKLHIDGSSATASGKVLLDRRDFGVGSNYADEKTVGFGVTVEMAISATRK